MARYERAAVARFAHVIAVSEGDREAMSVMTDPARVSVVPTGVNVSEYRAGAGTTAVDPIVVFLGSMDWEANIDAVEYLLPGHLAGRSCCRARRAIPDRRTQPASSRPEAGVHVGRGDGHGACCPRSSQRDRRVRGPAAHRRRHAPQDLRGDGGRACGRLDVDRRRRARCPRRTGHRAGRHGRAFRRIGDRLVTRSAASRKNRPLSRRIGSGHDWQAVAKQLEAILLRVAASADSRPEDSLAERVAI